MERDTQKTKVIFRKFKDSGDIIALMPEMAGNMDVVTCMCYQHIGQHGTAWLLDVMEMSKPAKPEEYIPLYNELTARGYNIRIAHKSGNREWKMRFNEIHHL